MTVSEGFIGCPSGGIGRHVRLRCVWATVRVRVPPRAPFSIQAKSLMTWLCYLRSGREPGKGFGKTAVFPVVPRGPWGIFPMSVAVRCPASGTIFIDKSYGTFRFRDFFYGLKGATRHKPGFTPISAGRFTYGFTSIFPSPLGRRDCPTGKIRPFSHKRPRLFSIHYPLAPEPLRHSRSPAWRRNPCP